MSKAAPWEDRRGLSQRGKEVHEPGRKMSNSGLIAGTGSAIMDGIRRASVSSTGSGSGSLVDKPLTNDASAPGSPTSQRRRSSAAGGKFGNLQQHKRGSESYQDRKASQAEMMGGGGLVAGWFNKTFRGVAGVGTEQNQQADQKRGVME